MNKLVLLALFPLIAAAFSVTNLPSLVAVESVQPMDSLNITFKVDGPPIFTNGTATLFVEFNTEPTQIPRMVFQFCGNGIAQLQESTSSSYPTNSSASGHYRYSFTFADPQLPDNSRLLVREQGYFGGPVGSSFGLDCAGIAHIDWASGLIWLPLEDELFRFGDYDGNDIELHVLGGQFQRPQAMRAMALTPEGGLE